jgi:hypothetical protein
MQVLRFLADKIISICPVPLFGPCACRDDVTAYSADGWAKGLPGEGISVTILAQH